MVSKRTSFLAKHESRRIACGLACIIAAATLIASAHAANLDGSWSTDRAACGQLFVKKGSQTHLARDADIHGSGFVIDGTMIRGKIANCKITSRRDVGRTVHVRAACATDVAVSDSTFDLKVIDDDQVVRSVPGIPEMDTPYYRCR